MLNFVDKNSFVKQTDTSYLSIQANLNGFSFCVTNAAGACIALVSKDYSKPVLSYDDLASELRPIFDAETLLRQKYAGVCCMFLSNKVMLMPRALLDKEHLRLCLERVVSLDDLDEIHFRDTSDPEAAAVFAIPSPLAATVAQQHPNAVFMHQSLALLHHLSTCFEWQRASLYIEGNIASIILFRKNRMVLCNSFFIENFIDAIYYLSFAAKEWDIDPAFLSLYYMGGINEENKRTLEKYYPMVHFVSGEVVLQVGYYPSIRYQPLLLLHKCV